MGRHRIVFVLAQDDLGLDVFESEQAAIMDCEAIDVETGNYLFCDFVGRPLRPVFPKQGRIASFVAPSDTYHLEAGSSDGDLLLDVLGRAAYLETNELFDNIGELRAYLQSQ